ncbi:MAG: helix-turn-helix transcriptional regulator [Candidatus Eisenbacteria bacterium]|uniref:Helix-turn-helix transcriptional regulator n=1 Tax=Eiseniibacteriota bacterium TaxID=2212470 RepID=A0A538SA73_UNCEI|nr:MAG: helix-turn-helix transcriptional regulator [Candidatus Eisenbacteria bacterium]
MKQILRRARLAAGLKLRDVSKFVGVDPTSLWNYECGRFGPLPENRAKWVRALRRALVARQQAIGRALVELDRAVARAGSERVGAPSRKRASSKLRALNRRSRSRS